MTVENDTKQDPIIISKILYKGVEKVLEKKLIASGVKPDVKCYGALTGNIHGYKCPRCQKSWGYVFMDKSGAMFFCGEKSCLTDDKEASLAIERTKIKNQERDA